MTPEQAHPSKDRPSHTRRPCLGILLADTRQECPWLWSHLRIADRHQPHWQPVFLRWIHCTHRPASMATILLHPHCQGPSPHFDAYLMPRMGHRTSLNGSMPQLRLSPRRSLLPWPLRSRLPSTLQHHNSTVVSSIRTAYASRCLVWH